MNVEEILVAKELSEEDLAEALAFTFHIVPEEVAIVTEVTGDEDLNTLKIICQYEEIQGDFKLKLQIFGITTQDQDLFVDLIKKLA